MSTERVTERPDGSTERVIERDDAPSTGGGSGLGVIIGIALLALVAIVGFYLLNQSRNDNLRTSAVTGAASSVAHSASGAAKSVGDAADSVANH